MKCCTQAKLALLSFASLTTCEVPSVFRNALPRNAVMGGTGKLAEPLASKPMVAVLVSFVGFAFGGIRKVLRLLRRDGKNDGRFTAGTAELIAGNVGATFHFHAEEQVFARVHSSGNCGPKIRYPCARSLMQPPFRAERPWILEICAPI